MHCAFVTFGCKINTYDTQAIRETVLELGYREARGDEPLDLVVVNACTVTARAGAKGVAAVRRLRRRHRGARILVTGCLTDADRAALTEIDGIEHVIGNEEKDQIPALLQGGQPTPTRGRRSRNIFNLAASRFDRQTRAFLKIHDGCDSFCTYCIIPYVRGKSKSRPVADAVAEARRFAEAGHRELVLTGIHLSQYGKDLGIRHGLVDLLRRLRQIEGIDRVRLSSIGEGVFSEAFLALFANDPGLCPFFHIPLQSGSDDVLRRMRRDYTTADYLVALERIRRHLPRAVITTDLVVGFPGETDEEFERTLGVCRAARFAKIHLFPYSVRARTKAARLPGHVSPPIKQARMRQVRHLERELILAERRRWLGQTVQVLVEREDSGFARGLTREGLPTRFPVGATRRLWNQEVIVAIDGYSGEELRGRECHAQSSGNLP